MEDIHAPRDPQIIRMDNLIQRYQACVYKIWDLFPSDPLPEDDPAHFLIERLESILDRKLLQPRCQCEDTLESIDYFSNWNE